MRKKCNVCGVAWVISETGNNICDDCYTKFNMSGSRKIPNSSSKWQGKKHYTTGG